MNTAKQDGAFISYSRQDQKFALEFAKELKSAGYLIWLDLLDIPTGARWDDEVEKALREHEIFLIILTPASVSSENVKDEIGLAIDNGKHIIPVLLKECVIPLRLRRYQYVDFTKLELSEGIRKAKQLLETPLSERATAEATIHRSKEAKPISVTKIKIFRLILSGVLVLLLVGVVSVLAVLRSRHTDADSLPTPTVLVSSTVNIAPTLLQLVNGQPFNDPSGIGMCVGSSKGVAQSDRVNALSITFNNGQNGYCGWSIMLKGYNLSANKQITLWVKGEKGGEKYKVGIKDIYTESGKEPKVSKIASTEWTQVSIQLDEFTPHQDLTSLENFSISFESGSGKIYVDQLIFAP